MVSIAKQNKIRRAKVMALKRKKEHGIKLSTKELRLLRMGV